eukprot:NODE_1740_length_1315_cov_71.873618_g1449_i0.p1 GENE.NODE_1740_length_1315_cov_71.873618_g1449_i0~~NODE_1740_length_1315_cov_71.873618_g1449_i0.p1  ORF type:complete len:368 (+),score=108.69 NODE_1740_length_1315_cov_71.873618_g1449_i0:80-1105(+)
MRKRTIAAGPNEWLLVIRNGHLLKCGIGAQVFQWPFDQVVRFPTRINQVDFKAQQVTKEMSGIEVTGFINWVCYRNDDGPWRAFQNFPELAQGQQPSQANKNLARLAESIIRSQVANASMDEILKKRSELRQKIRQEFQAQVTGWGVWLETVEITEVRILSQTLFNDLQERFRQASHREAENIRMESQREIDSKRVQQDLVAAKEKADAEHKKHVYRLQKELERAREEEKLMEENQRIKKAKIQTEDELRRISAENEQKLENFKADQQRVRRKQEMELESEMSGVNQKMQVLRAVEEIYKALPIRDVRMVNVGGSSEGSGAERLVSQFAAAFQTTSAALSE